MEELPFGTEGWNTSHFQLFDSVLRAALDDCVIVELGEDDWLSSHENVDYGAHRDNQWVAQDIEFTLFQVFVGRKDADLMGYILWAHADGDIWRRFIIVPERELVLVQKFDVEVSDEEVHADFIDKWPSRRRELELTAEDAEVLSSGIASAPAK